ncbi:MULTISPECIES: hypothetical protein [unclassified Cupriavidus]|uniref:hypothetical protein n=1 Tax=unclassified Cupriavidus TaxID=2640874 RepID=UPI001BFFF626|nr:MULTISPECIES: hypothetical protein [unclassified Cupriavidus]MCA3184978.1 hypothetical protein [Cupriavidus sp.]MCA3193755.1 hypothetical protein [Cupriavidus sp.]MCA3196272.1 hypothetical protein [Cupriavidus sp.]MCA3203793.1 hypothetical protein [Cupriavidus sp.]MCA3207837.1 hypothetical protein [Cupriavidus sp.]
MLYGRAADNLRREAVIARETAPVDRRIALLREDIRWQLHYAKAQKARGFPARDYARVLRLLRRTLQVERAYRAALRKAALARFP